MAKPEHDGLTIVATNKRAHRNYDITETFEAGIMLRGSEVKSLREAKVTLGDAFGRIEGNELWIIGLHIGAYSNASDQGGHELERKRKLLLHRRELDRIRIKADIEHQSVVPLRLYFKNGKAKLEIGIGRGRKTVDKRQVIAERDADLEARRAMANQRKR